MFNLLTFIVCVNSQLLYYKDPGNDLTKPRTLSKIREGETNIDFYFEFSQDQQYVTMMIEIDKLSYFSFGIGESMSDADLWVFEIKDEVIVATDSHSVKHSKPPADTSLGGTNDIELLGYYYNKDGKSGVKFRRKANTGDKYDKILVQNQKVDFIWAHGKTEQDHTASNHGKLFRGTVGINLKDDGGQSDAEIEDMIDYYRLHKWSNFICWGILSDIAIMIGRYMKTWVYRTYVHGFLFILIVLSSISTAILMLSSNLEVLKWKNYSKESIKNEIHIIIFFILALCMVAQCIGGIIYNTQLISLKTNKIISIKPSYHQIFGTIVFLIGKLQILAGLFMDNDIRFMLILGLVITTRFVMEVLYQKNTLCVITKKNNKNKIFNKDALLPLNNSEFENIDDDKLWCIYRNQIVDLTNMNHPGGNYIWKYVAGYDITRYVLGGYSIKNLQNYKHSQYALQALLKFQTGILIQDYLELFYQNGNPLKQVKAIWTLKTTKPYSATTAYFGFENQQIQIKNTFTGLQTLGQYFIIRSNDFDDINSRQYTMVLSMTEERIQYRKELLELFKRVLSLQPINKEIPKLAEYCKELPLIIKKYESTKGFSKHIHEDNRNEQYIIEGPFGSPIFIDGHIVIIAGGTGLLPFLDLLDYQLRVSYYQLIKRILGDEAIQLIDLGLGNIQEFKITLLISVQCLDELVGKDIIFALQSLQQKLDQSNFKVIVRGNFKMKEIQVINEKFTENIIRQYVGVDLNEISNFLVCGPPKMNKELYKILSKIGRVTIL